MNAASLQEGFLLFMMLGFLILGIWQGFVAEVFGALGLFLAYIASPFLVIPVRLLFDTPDTPSFRRWSLAILGSLIYLGATAAGAKFHKNKIKGKWFRQSLDRLLGGGVGAIKGFVLATWFLRAIGRA